VSVFVKSIHIYTLLCTNKVNIYDLISTVFMACVRPGLCRRLCRKLPYVLINGSPSLERPKASLTSAGFKHIIFSHFIATSLRYACNQIHCMCQLGGFVTRLLLPGSLWCHTLMAYLHYLSADSKDGASSCCSIWRMHWSILRSIQAFGARSGEIMFRITGRHLSSLKEYRDLGSYILGLDGISIVT
jgi:hypothetical protein